MKISTYFISIFLVTSLFADGSVDPDINSSDYISTLKQQQINYEYKGAKYQFASDLLAPINDVTFRYDVSRGGNGYGDYNNFGIMVNQPIFQAGSIYYSFKYSFDNRKYNKLKAKQYEKGLILDSVILLYNIVNAEKSVKKQTLNVKNYEIDVRKKREEFAKGLVDSVDLNNAIRDKNREEKSLLDLKQKLKELQDKWHSVSDTDYKRLKPPVFKLVDKSSYVDRHLDLSLLNVDAKIKRDQSRQFWGKNYLSVNVFYGYNKKDYRGINDFDDNGVVHNYGVSITVPFSFSRISRGAKLRVSYLNSEIAAIDKEREVNDKYKTYKANLKKLDAEVNITKDDIKLYSDILGDTKEQYQSGFKTKHDVEVFQNSYDMLLLDLEMLKISRNEVLANMYKEML